ncbi:MAG: hypothetical protein ISR58_20730 [Anaerolineales bacterium]|nr:hypothetical protein [Chloroflexota bacterium]MBL6983615.1 hypothetical protein [Anaerolineales bacterium]
MNSHSSPPVKDFVFAALFLAIVGWIGLIAIVFRTLPTLGPRWLFFFLLVFAITGSMLPVTAFLNRRFPTSTPTRRVTVIREALLIGFFIAALAWLQLFRVLTPTLIIFLALGIGFVEWMTRLWEGSRWEP